MYFFVYLLLCTLSCRVFAGEIKIGGLFNPSDQYQEIAFRHAINTINANPKILPGRKLKAEVEYVLQDDSYYASMKACSLLEKGIAGIFGPQSLATASHVESICDNFEVPYMETKWDDNISQGSFSINLYPHYQQLGKAYSDLITSLSWNSFAIIYETNEGLVRVQEILKSTKSTFNIYQLPLDNSTDISSIVKGIMDAGVINVVLDCSIENTNNILKEFQQNNMMTKSFSYLITSLDLYTIDLEDFKNEKANILGFRLFDPDNIVVQKTIREWSSMTNSSQSDQINKLLQIKNILIYDAVYLFAEGLKELNTSLENTIRPLHCQSKNTTNHGYTLINYIKISEMNGLTNMITLDNQGLRTNFELDIIELSNRGFDKIGTWNKTGVKINGIKHFNVEEIISNKSINVVVKLGMPFCGLVESTTLLEGNDRFEGFTVDFIKILSKIMNFDYSIYVVPDNSYGSLDKRSGKWPGLIGQVLDKKADIAIADLTITSQRNSVVDFTVPFMSYGISTLYYKTKIMPLDLSTFLSPFSFVVWICIIAAYIIVSLLLFFLGRFSPYENNGKVSNTNILQATENADTNFSILNCLWFMIGSLLFHGCNIFPRALSTRLLTGIWWLFNFLVITSYIANLTILLSVQKANIPYGIESIEELVKEQKVQFGCIHGGATSSFFRNSQIPLYQNIWSIISNTEPSSLASNNDEGVARVLAGEGSYAFFMESTTLEYFAERNCDLTQIGGLINAKGYGIAMRKNSPLLSKFNEAILNLLESGKLTELRNKWWNNGQNLRNDCPDYSSIPTELSIEYFGGIFIILFVGIIIAFVIGILEYIIHKKKKRTT